MKSVNPKKGLKTGLKGNVCYGKNSGLLVWNVSIWRGGEGNEILDL